MDCPSVELAPNADDYRPRIASRNSVLSEFDPLMNKSMQNSDSGLVNTSIDDPAGALIIKDDGDEATYYDCPEFEASSDGDMSGMEFVYRLFGKKMIDFKKSFYEHYAQVDDEEFSEIQESMEKSEPSLFDDALNKTVIQLEQNFTGNVAGPAINFEDAKFKSKQQNSVGEQCSVLEFSVRRSEMHNSEDSTCTEDNSEDCTANNSDIAVVLNSTQVKSFDDLSDRLKLLHTDSMSEDKDRTKSYAKKIEDPHCKKCAEMAVVLDEYEKSIAGIIAAKEELRKDKESLQVHLSNSELAFSDVYQKYEKCKGVLLGFKKNEEQLKQSMAEYEAALVKSEYKYGALKSHAMAQLQKSNEELEQMRKEREMDVSKYTAIIKRLEIKSTSMMEALQQKTKECEQLSQVCDEMMEKCA